MSWSKHPVLSLPRLIRPAAGLCCACLLLGAGWARAAEIDRLVAAVNGSVITERDLDLARNLRRILFRDGKSAATRAEEIEQQIERELMRQELENFGMPEVEEARIEERLSALRLAAAAQGGLSALLRAAGLQEAELISYIRLEASILKFVDFRFRPFAGVTGDEVRAYYDGRLAPQLRESGIELPALEQVAAKIEQILREEKINAILEQWMRDVRSGSRVEYFTEAP